MRPRTSASPSIVLMENAGRQVVAAMEAMFPDLSLAEDRRARGPGQQRRRRVRRRADAGAAGRRRRRLPRGVDRRSEGRRADQSRRARAPGAHGHRDRRRDRSGSCSSPTCATADLLVDALFGTGLRTPLTGLYETIVADINASDLPVVSVDLPSGLSADTPDPIGPCIDATPHRHARRAEAAAGAAAGRGPLRRRRDRRHRHPRRRHRRGRGPAPRAADTRAHALDDRAAAGRLAQGRLRPRARRRRLAGQDRRGASVGDGRAQVGRGPGHHRDAALLPGRAGDDGAGVHDRRARRGGRRPGARRARAGAGASRPTSSRSVRGWAPAPGTVALVQGLLERAGMPLVLDADALNAFVGEPRAAGRARRTRRHHHAASRASWRG